MSREFVLHQRGFTLIEVLIVIVMIGVLLAIAAPSFVTFTASQRVKTASFDLYAALTFARSEAIKRRQAVTVAPAAGTDWATGCMAMEGEISTLRAAGVLAVVPAMLLITT